MSDKEAIVLPKWIASAFAGACSLIGVVMMGAVPWAWRISSDVAEIRARLVGATDVSDRELRHVREHLDAVRRRLEALEGNGQSRAVGRVGTF